MNKKQIRKMQTASGGPIYEEDWSDKLEPYAASVGLAGDVVGLGTAATGVGIPVGAAIAGFANIPNLIIDGYQTARDTWRSFNDNGNSLGSAAWNGGELILDAAGLKALQYINKAAKAGVASEKYLTSTEKALDSKPWKRVGTGHGRVRARQSADHKRKYNSGRNKALEESINTLAKKGVREAQGEYFKRKLADEMAKRGYGVAVNDAIKSANRTVRQNLGIISGVSGGTNVYHLLPKHKSGGQVRKMQTAAGGPLFPWQQNTEWVDNWKFRTTPASRSRVLSGKGVETDKQYTERRKKETTKRTWRSDAADVAHGIGEGILALNPYTAIPYFGAKVGQDFLNGTYGWHTALNASVPLFHLAPQAVGLREATNVALEDAANAGSKTARNWRVAREIKQATKNKPKYTRVPSKSLFRTQVYKGGEITDPYSNFVTTDPQYAANYGKVTPYIFESKSVAKAKEPMMGSSDPVTMDMFVYNNTKGNPNATAIIGHDKVTGEFAPSRGIEIYSMSPTNLFKINNSRKGKIFTGFEEQQRLLDILNNSYNTPHPPIYERVSYSKYSADAANPKDIIRLFRATGTSGKFKPSLDGTQEFVGQWFTNDIRKPLKYASSTFKKAKISKESNPVELQVVEIPTSEINKYKASELLKGRTDIEYEPTEDFLIPLDYPRQKYPIEGLTGNLLQDMRLKLPIEKQGGKMNILEFLKNGSGIHIKEKNKGKFTSYCGGKVTDECIRKAKASGNPTLVKRATFADNARHFKHRSGGKIDFYNLGGWFKNTFNNVSSFLGSDMGKSVLSIGSGLIGLGNGISNSGKIADAANEAEEAVDAQEFADKQKSFTKEFNTILQEKLSKPDIDVNGSPIHTNGVNIANEAYNQAINTFKFDNSEYNQMRKYIKEQAQQVQNENSSSMIGSVGGLIDSIGGIAGSLLNKKSTTPKSSQIITGSPDSSKQVITTNSGMRGTVDDWRKAILG